MKEIALITGASGGIGHQLALLFSQKNIPLLLVARNEARLRQLKAELEKANGTAVYYVAADLSTTEGVAELLQYVHANQLHVTYLVNNAGFGDYGNFVERSLEKYLEMLQLNVVSLTQLTHHFARLMVQHGSGRILNVASTAGLQPDPYFAVYGATKAYVISLTEALHKELEHTGVTATVLSPGPTQTDFMARADMAEAKLYAAGVMTARDVAHTGFRAMMAGKLHVIPGFKNRVLGFFSSITPSGSLRLAISAGIMGRKTKT
ncbi:MAG: SDR family NAD(P)-dependent oxidoreductase [Flammeovirgaceae bacterium]